MSSKRMLIIGLAVTALGAGAAAQKTTPTGGPAVEVYKTPTCGCCSKWVEHMRAAGFQVKFTDVPQAELDEVKAKHGVPESARSCHTALTNGYVIEGHIPAPVVQRLLKEKPKVAGLAVPGMPTGSPGMEVPGRPAQQYDVLSFDTKGQTKVFATQKP